MSPPATDHDPIRLAIFVINSRSGRPIPRVPVFAEIVWANGSPRAPLPPPTDRYNTWIERALAKVDRACSDSPKCRQRLMQEVSQTIQLIFDDTGIRQLLASGEEGITSFLIDGLTKARLAVADSELNNVASGELLQALEDGLRTAAEKNGFSLKPYIEDQSRTTSFPLGVLGSDHVGYISFDLETLPAQVREAVRDVANRDSATALASADPRAQIFVYPSGKPALRRDALQQRRFTIDAVVMRMDLGIEDVPDSIANLGLLAMQSPSITDWRLSPGSFATNPASLIGADGCESIVPANVAVHEYSFYQVVGFGQREVELPIDGAAASHVR